MEEGATCDDPGTGLEEPMRQLSLGEPDYPQRPGEPNCEYYMRTGSCGYGEKCRYNHPRNRFTETGDYPERVGQSLCQYFMKTGTCKFGASCKYHHPRRGGPANPVQLNSSGYPLRLEERECSYYMKTGGLCKFGASCKFNHPELTGGSAATVLTGPTFFPAVQSQSTGSSGQLPAIAGWQLSPGSYFPGSYGPTLFIPGVVPFSGWSPYPSSVNQVQSGAAYLPPSSVSSSGSVQQENTFPERPGQPECQYYIKTGSCKFGSTCKYHHPREWGASKINCSLSPLGLPLRPGASACAFYMQHGQCKFGPSCKYDHPMGALMGYTPPASSLSNTPLVSFPTGNVSLPSTTAQASSTLSSQDERHRLKSG